MKRLENCRSVDDIDKCFSRRVTTINECIDLRYVDQSTSSFFRGIESSIVDIREIFKEVKLELNEGRRQVKELEGVKRSMENFKERVEDMLDNVPEDLQRRSSPERESIAITPVPSAYKQEKAKEVKLPANISCLSKAEFEHVPKYMKGRIQYPKVNDFINTFNEVINMKYKLLTVPHKSLKSADYKAVNTMKSEETEETKGKYFCTGENLKEYGNIKMDRTTNAFLQILRHCNRIKEVRGPRSLIRYVIKV